MTITRLRAAGIWIIDDHVLMESLRGHALWGIPGGGIEPHESAEECVLREYREEIGIKMRVIEAVVVHQNFWMGDDGRRREYCFYFRVEPTTPMVDSLPDIVCVEPGVDLEFRWMPLSGLDELTLVPRYIPDFLSHMDAGTRFISTSEL